ncbi:fungal-specific transcription factor domain-containing protein [Xylogone sp. PMI_703]|nr:fungal-specific transcription factor domain-containing protein [Xylogone sp. PMI_703]
MAAARPASEVSSNLETSGGKRRRISLACSACRARKSRCDGARPKCSGCRELQFDCVYVQSASSSNIIIGKEYLSSIEERLKAVEENIAALRDGQIHHQRHSESDGGDDNEISNNAAASVAAQVRSSPTIGANTSEVQHLVTLEEETVGVGDVIFSVEEDCGFFGPSSNISFNHHISRAVAHLFSINPNWPSSSDNESQRLQSETAILSASRPSTPFGNRGLQHINSSQAGERVNIYAIPSEARTRELISQYFNDTGVLFPYIHEGTFFEAYNDMRNSNFTRVRRSWLGLLNMVMALATSTTVDPSTNAENRVRESDVYYQRAKGLCEKLIMRGTSLEIVQLLLVMGQYLQGTQRSVETWTIQGLAVKAALQLGLHSAKASARFSPLIQEFRKRTWYGCMVLDRTLSMTFGRPSAIPEEYVILDLPTPLDSGDPKHELSVGFFNGTITLYRIMWKVIHTLYGGNIDSENRLTVIDNISRILSMEQLLVDWERQLLPTLALHQASDIAHLSVDTDVITKLSEKLRIILTLRHHNLRVLLHRPILVNFLNLTGDAALREDSQSIALLQHIGSNSIQICVQSSIEIISIIHTIVFSTGERRTWLGAWWFCLYYTFNAALVLFSSLLIVQNQTNLGSTILPFSLSPSDIQTSLLNAAALLRRLDTGNRMIDKVAAYVDKLIGVLKTLAATKASSVSLAQDSNGINNITNPALFNNEDIPFNNDIFQSFPDNITSDTSPVGMDLGEFMVDEDIDFLNQLAGIGAAMGMNKDFDYSQQPMPEDGKAMSST